MTRLFGIVPAAGGGTRFGAGFPKQYALLAGVPVLAHTLDRLQAGVAFERLVVALAPEDRLYDQVIGSRTGIERIACGGASRSETVRNALRALAPRCRVDDWVLVHDAARPCVPQAALSAFVDALWNDAVGGLLALPVGDTLKHADGEGSAPRALATADRAMLWRAQTPQMFRYGLLIQALEADRAGTATDDAQAIEALGHRPRLMLGSSSNIKLTYADDLVVAAAILASQAAAAHAPPPAGPTS